MHEYLIFFFNNSGSQPFGPEYSLRIRGQERKPEKILLWPQCDSAVSQPPSVNRGPNWLIPPNLHANLIREIDFLVVLELCGNSKCLSCPFENSKISYWWVEFQNSYGKVAKITFKMIQVLKFNIKFWDWRFKILRENF